MEIKYQTLLAFIWRLKSFLHTTPSLVLSQTVKHGYPSHEEGRHVLCSQNSNSFINNFGSTKQELQAILHELSYDNIQSINLLFMIRWIFITYWYNNNLCYIMTLYKWYMNAIQILKNLTSHALVTDLMCSTRPKNNTSVLSLSLNFGLVELKEKNKHTVATEHVGSVCESNSSDTWTHQHDLTVKKK